MIWSKFVVYSKRTSSHRFADVCSNTKTKAEVYLEDTTPEADLQMIEFK